METCSKNNIEEEIKYLAISKQLNILIGSGVSFPAIPLMRNVEGNTQEEKNENLVSIVACVSQTLLSDNLNAGTQQTLDNYYNFLYQVIQLLNMSNSRQIPRSVNIFTTNYDLFIEKAIDNLSTENKFVFNDGANGYFNRYIDSSNYNRVVSYKGLNDNYINEISSINLIKPHGSVNWERVSNKILVHNDVVKNCVVVKPTGLEEQETFLNNHFHEMLRMFQLELDKPQTVLFVVGFSFQDRHIAKMFKRALQNIELLAYIFCFTDEERDTIKNNLNIQNDRHNLRILSPKDFNENILEKFKNESNENYFGFTIKSLTKIFQRNQND
ncbi:SIR2 family protein [Faecalicoccus acidiformans]|uniref:SIR2 family protein n=1 Tax=Faecalicoccus acidiformans TaxID=915173 RepID=UPI0025A407B1|nr:SIR2 family protein [Faecalicoccus acidiformans]MDM8202786.1 SIR2 family protein [Faecalicoccus acidiformans]